MALRIVFLLMGLGFWFYFQYEYRLDIKANITLIGAITAFKVAVYFQDIETYIGNKDDK
nr:hypothetical protein [Bacillus velezensis]